MKIRLSVWAQDIGSTIYFVPESASIWDSIATLAPGETTTIEVDAPMTMRVGVGSWWKEVNIGESCSLFVKWGRTPPALLVDLAPYTEE